MKDSGSRSSVPSGYRRIDRDGVTVMALPEAVAWVEEALARPGTLYDAAASAAVGAAHQGRAPVHVVRHGDTAWAARHYVRGGAVAAPLLEDRYLRVGEPRPFRELRTSERVRARGIPTPRVVAAAVYRSGPFYRGDLLTRYVAGAATLADELFAEPGPSSERRRRMLQEAGTLVGRMAAEGVRHPDLNADNILITGKGEGMRAMLLDLDRCGAHRRRTLDPDAMLRRLERSLRKLGRRRGGLPSGDGWATLREAARRASGAGTS